jgi:phospholipid/cholesterol/gamma-HCH transport system substrate-binding protein
MDLHYKQEVTVGVLVLAGVGLFIGGTMWLRGRSFSTAPEVQIVFPDVGTLSEGSPVRVSGVELGAVERIEFQDVGKVLVGVSLNPTVKPKIDATARLTTVGLVGDAAILLHPGTSTELLPPNRPIQGVVDQGLTELGTDLGNRAKEVMTGVQEFTNREMAAEFRETLRAFQRALDVFSNTRRGPTAELTRTMESLQRLSHRLDSTLAAAELAGTLRKSDTLITTLTGTSAQFTTTTARLDTLLQKLTSGEGTAGKLMTDSLLYGDLRRLSKSAQELIDELRKHPGKITVQIKVF